MNQTAILQCGDLIENHERVLSACKYLQRIGVTPRPLVYSDDGAFFDQHGIKVVRLADMRRNIKTMHHMTDEEFDDIVELEKRRSSSGQPPRSWSQYRVLREYTACNRMIEALQPDYLIVWNGFTGMVANILRVLKSKYGLPGGFMERGIVKGSVYFDPDGVNGDSMLGKLGSTQLGDEISSSAFSEISLGARWMDVGRASFMEAFKKPREKVIFVPLQVQGDTNIILHSQTIKKMRTLVLLGSRLARSLGPDWKVVVRRHPEEDPNLQLNLPKISNVVHRNDTDLKDELAKAQATLTINSTVGLEAALGGGFVMTLGEGVYCREEFVHRIDVSDQEALLEKIENHYSKPNERYEKLRRYLNVALGCFHFPSQSDFEDYPLSSVTRWFRGRAPDMSAQTTTLHEAISEKLRAFVDHGRRIKIDNYLSPENKIDITYRLAKVPVSCDFIEGALQRYIAERPRIDVSSKHEPGVDRLAIAPSTLKDFEKLSRYQMVFDERMNIHPVYRDLTAVKANLETVK